MEKVLNKKEYVMDMTEGSSMKLIMKFSVPLLIGNLFQQVYSLVDSIVVGRHLGANALGGVGSVGMISFLFFSLCNGMASGIGVVISRYFGAKKEEQVKKAIANALFVILAVGALMSILGYCFAGPIIRLMKTPAETFDYAYTYMRITCGFTIAVAIYNGISAVLRALGDSKTPLIFLMIASAINVVLDIVFVIYMDMGVAGAAYATVLSQILSSVGSICYAVKTNPYFRLKRGHFKFDRDIMKEDFSIGIPMAVQTSMISISCSILQTLINGYGPEVMAAYTATGKVEGIIFQPFSSLGLALSTFAGQNCGARKYERVRRAVWQTGMGDVVFSMLNGALEVGGRIVFALILMYVLKMGFWGVWYTNIFTWIVIALTASVRFSVYIRKCQREDDGTENA